MKNITLEKLELKNFKGIKDLTIDFASETNIYGKNATGKTTIFDSFTWLLFGKDSANRSDFNIKTLNKDGEAIHGLEHEVTGTLNIGGKKVILRRALKENWVKKRGSAEQVFSGNVTDYFINEEPKKEKEYKEYINTIVDEDVFKLLSNPMHFNVNIDWKKRREILLNLVGDITDEEVMNSSPDLKKLAECLGENSIGSFKAIIASKKKKLNEQLKAIPIRIDEINIGLPVLAEDVDYDAVEKRKGQINADMFILDSKLNSQKQAAADMAKKQTEVFAKKSLLKDLELKIEKDSMKVLQELKFEKMRVEYDIEKKQKDIDYRKTLIESLTIEMAQSEKEAAELRHQYAEEFSKVFEEPDHNNFICPTCKQHLPEDNIEAQIERMKENFETEKAKKLNTIKEKGKLKVEKKDECLSKSFEYQEGIKKVGLEINDLNSKIAELNGRIEQEEAADHTVNYDANFEYEALKIEIANMEKNILPIDENNRIREQSDELQNELIRINQLLSDKRAITDAQARIKELKSEEKYLAQQVAALEGQEFLTEQFIRAKVNMLEDKINKTFKYVTFKMFDVQQNGGINETCQALVNGVPYQDVNNSAKINAGLDIINALCKFYDVNVPVFVDNAESINVLLPIYGQIVRLIVTEDKNLRIEKSEGSKAA